MNSVPTPGENYLVHQWFTQKGFNIPLSTTTGEKLAVIYPGKHNKAAGPDFKGAILALENGELLSGDIEIDVSSHGWRCHGHDRNPLYNKVILHLVFKSGAKIVEGEAGLNFKRAELIPNGYTGPGNGQDHYHREHTCPAAFRLKRADIQKIVEMAGQQRFRNKAWRFQQAVTTRGTGQALYQGFMEALGYSHNKIPFLRLSSLLTWNELSYLMGSKTRDPADVEALFLGSAGLLPSQAENKCPHSTEEAVTVLENSWASWKKRQLLQRRDWVFFKVRPANTPPRRIAAAAYLLIHRWLPDPVESLLPFLENKDHLAKILVAPAGDYWTDHMDFNVPAPYSRNLIGRDRAGETVVNVFLPFLYALGNVRRWHKLRSHAMDIYMSSPAMAEYGINQVMKNRLLDCLPGNTALQQQGLLHIYKNYCCSQRCATCPIARSRLLHHCENTPDEPC